MKGNLIDEFLETNIKIKNKNQSCTVEKDFKNSCVNKCRTTGVLLSVLNCGFINGYREILTAESLTQVTIFLLDLIEYAEKLPIYFIYDNACHLKPFIENNNMKKTERGKTLLRKTFVIDRLHLKNHVSPQCKLNYNPDLYDDLEETNTVACEQANYWAGGYKHIMKHMNDTRFNVFLYIICNLYNERKLISK
jgi:hypothetical protein